MFRFRCFRSHKFFAEKKREIKFIKIYLKTMSIKSLFGGNKKDKTDNNSMVLIIVCVVLVSRFDSFVALFRTRLRFALMAHCKAVNVNMIDISCF